MERFSVKKPFTILVAVIMVLALGYVSLTNLSTDLLPAISLPYMMVITPYPGASPEKVEAQVTEPLENALGTISGVKTVYSVNAENYSMVQLEFEDGTDMDSAMVKVSGAIDQTSGALPDGAGTPSVLELSMDMLASMYVAVSHDGYDVYELSDYVEREVVPYLQRQNGVANVTAIGMVDRTVQVDLKEDKIRAVNDRILAMTSDALADAKEQLDAAKEQVSAGQQMLQEQESAFGSMVSGALFSQMQGGVQSAAASLQVRLNSLVAALQVLQNAVNTQGVQAQTNVRNSMSETSAQLTETQTALTDVYNRIDEVNAQIIQLQAELDACAQEMQNGTTEEIVNDIEGQPVDGADAFTQLDQHVNEELQRYMEELQNELGQRQAELEELERQRAELETAVTELIAKLQQTDGSQQQMEEVLYNSPEQMAVIQAEFARLLEQASAQTGQEAADMTTLMRMVTEMAGISGQAAALLDRLSAIDAAGALSAQITQARSALENLSSAMDSVPSILSGLQLGVAGLTQGQLDAAVGFSTAASQLASAEQQLQAAEQQYESSRSEALANANVDQLVSPSTLSSLIYAQNFSMPAGYIDDAEDNSWLLKVGDEYETTGAIADALLIRNDALGTIRLSDVADVTVIDNAGDSYAKLNGEQGIILSIYKASTASTNDVSRACNAAFAELEAASEGTHLVALVDQGIYITMIIRSVLSSMLLGSLLAIIILALFLRDLRPTLVVGISIPLSVLFAIVLIYFSDLSLDMMTLSGLALGIGMLVDNSIVVMENIFRLRQSGVAAPRAAVQGARQVRGAIVASTLTTVCVFLPMVFTTGTVRELLLPMALSIGYCLTASLLTALTVVPAAASTIMRNVKPKEHRFTDKVQDAYGSVLGWCLRFKIVPLAAAGGLLAFSVWMVLRMGIVLLPEMTTNNVQVDIRTAEGMDRQASYREVDAIMEQILKVDGVEHVGIMDQGSSAGLMASVASDSSSYGTYLCYVAAPENADSDMVHRICREIEAIPISEGCTVTAAAGGMSDMTSLISGAGLTVEIFGRDLDKLQEISRDVQEMIRQEKGFSQISDGTEEGEPTLHLVIDRDKVMEKGLTVAQVYADIAARLQTSVTSTTVTLDGIEMDVVVRNGTEPLTKENLLDMELGTSSSAAAAMSGQGGSMMSMLSGGSGMSMGGSGLSGASAGFDMSAFSGEASGTGAAGLAGTSGAADSADSSDTSGTEGASDGEADPDAADAGGASGTAGSGGEKETLRLRDVAELEETSSLGSISRRNQTRYLTLTAASDPGYNTALQVRELQPKVDEYNRTLPGGYSVEIAGQNTEIQKMLTQMAKLMLLAFLFIYLVMVAQFQSLLSPFIVLFTIPLAFTGGLIGLLIAGQELSMLALMGFLVLMGTVVNNGIVFVDYANQLRLGGLERRQALIATGKTRMRAILMTAMTTILAMGQLIFGKDIGSQMGSGMAIVIAGGLAYATLMTLFIIPVMYDIFFKRNPLLVDTGDDLDDEIDDAAAYIRDLDGNNISDKAAAVETSGDPEVSDVTGDGSLSHLHDAGTEAASGDDYPDASSDLNISGDEDGSDDFWDDIP